MRIFSSIFSQLSNSYWKMSELVLFVHTRCGTDCSCAMQPPPPARWCWGRCLVTGAAWDQVWEYWNLIVCRIGTKPPKWTGRFTDRVLGPALNIESSISCSIASSESVLSKSAVCYYPEDRGHHSVNNEYWAATVTLGKARLPWYWSLSLRLPVGVTPTVHRWQHWLSDHVSWLPVDL